MEQINVTRRKTLIFECEFLAIFLALYSWRDTLHGCKVLMYTDNDAVRDCVISCNTTSVNAVPILDACLEIESRLSLNFERLDCQSSYRSKCCRRPVQVLQRSSATARMSTRPNWSSDVLESLGRLQKGEALTSDAIPYGKTCALQLQNARVVRFNFKEAIRHSESDLKLKLRWWTMCEPTELCGLRSMWCSSFMSNSICYVIFFLEIFTAHPQPPFNTKGGQAQSLALTSDAIPYGKTCALQLQNARVVRFNFNICRKRAVPRVHKKFSRRFLWFRLDMPTCCTNWKRNWRLQQSPITCISVSCALDCWSLFNTPV